MAKITREEALRRWRNALRQKHETTERIVKEMVSEFEREHGEKPKYIEVW